MPALAAAGTDTVNERLASGIGEAVNGCATCPIYASCGGAAGDGGVAVAEWLLMSD